MSKVDTHLLSLQKVDKSKDSNGGSKLSMCTV